MTNAVAVTEYDLYESSLLPAPFASDCIDYEESSNGHFSSQADCYDKCSGKHCVQTFGSKMPGIRQDVSDGNTTNMSRKVFIANIQKLIQIG
jgi:hypothetical protein